jgi:hypothetical protein
VISRNLDGCSLGGTHHSGHTVEITNGVFADPTGWNKYNDKFEAQLEKVIKALRADTTARDLPPKPRL